MQCKLFFQKKKILITSVLILVISIIFPLSSCGYQDIDIAPTSATGYSSDTIHDASKCIDDDLDSYYETPSPTKDECVLRNVDISFDAVYSFSYINIQQDVGDKYIGTYNHYEIYGSRDGINFNKVAYKANDNIANSDGETYSTQQRTLRTFKACKIRVNLSFNSYWGSDPNGISGMQCPLQNITFKGHKIGGLPNIDDNVHITNFVSTSYGQFHSRFNNDASFKEKEIKNQLSALVKRILGNKYASYFIFELSPNNIDQYIIESSDKKIKIIANNGISLASGFNYYIKNYLQVDYNPMFSSHLIDASKYPPNKLPIPSDPITNQSHYDYRYALNYCTYSYTMSFWGWTQWQEFLDWAAMNGINLMLDIVGQEEALRETLLQFNYTDQEAREYIAGPAYQAWFMMGNMTGLGGPLSTQWFEQRVNLARMIHQCMEIYGITPVLQGWCGSVPDDFVEKNPNTYVLESNEWCGFEHHQNLIDSRNGYSKNVFANFYSKYYDHQIDLFGNISAWRSSDPFHEREYQGFSKGSLESAEIYLSILQAMKEKNENFKWLMQQWNSIAKNDLQAIEDAGFNSHLMILDLYADVLPNHDSMEETHTQWIWTMINNFGGRMGIYGFPQNLINLPLPNSTPNTTMMKGIGVAPESFGNSPMLYEELFDVNWMSTRPTTNEYVNQYLNWSYGFNDESTNADSGAWSYMLNTAYNPSRPTNGSDNYQGAPESVFNARPKHNLNTTPGNGGRVSTWGGTKLYYNASEFSEALLKFINAYHGNKDSDNSPNFIYDMTDVLRQCIQNTALGIIGLINSTFNSTDSDMKWNTYKYLASDFIWLLNLQNDVLTKTPTFNIAYWIDQARNDVMNNMDDWTKDQMELNARMLVTTWGAPKHANPGGLHDYSNRQWSGLTETLYKFRWERFFNETIKNKSEFFTADWFKYEWEWTNRKSDEGYDFSKIPDSRSLKELAQEYLNML